MITGTDSAGETKITSRARIIALPVPIREVKTFWASAGRR